jgi:hypothetical protein
LSVQIGDWGDLKNFKFFKKTFGLFGINYYFCTRKYGNAQRQKRVAEGAGEKRSLKNRYNNQVRKN